MPILSAPRPRRSHARITALAAIALLGSAILAACGNDTPAEAPFTPTGADSALGGGYPRFQDEATGFSVILGTPDLAVGNNRFAFVLSDRSGLVRLPVLRIASFGPDDDLKAAEQATTSFYEFPLGIRGIHVTELSFDRPGEWTVEVRVPRPSGDVATTRFPFTVASESESPAVGDEVPRSVSRTLEDVDALEQLSTGSEVDAAFYSLSIHEALATGQPSMVVFASPGFCTNALCGPQVEVMSELRAQHPEGINYIHVDLFENPVELRTGSLELAIRSPLLEEWRLETDEWTFLIDAAGRVTHRFEAFAPIEELEPALVSLLGE